MKVLFICKYRVTHYGISKGLVNSAQLTLNALNEAGIEAEIETVIDANSIDRVVTKHNPTHVMIQALWVTPEKMNELLSIPRHRNRKWFIRIHSKTPFIANEGIAFEWLWKYSALTRKFNNFFIAANNVEFYEEIIGVGMNAIYLPNIYYNLHPTFAPKFENKDHIDIGCFGAIRPMKNQLQQAVAAIIFAEIIGKQLRFHINGERTEQNGDTVLKNLRNLFNGSRHKLIEHGWLIHEKFLEVISDMDVGMQVSLTESFNIVAADFVETGVLIVGSVDIDWLPHFFRVEPTSSVQMVKKLETLYKYRKSRLLRWWLRYSLRRYNKKALKKWLYILEGCSLKKI